MALTGARHVATGSAVALTDLIPQVVRQLDVIAEKANAANIYIGGRTVATDGTGAYVCLAPGQSWSVKANRADQVNLGTGVYIVGTASDVAFLSCIV